MKEYDVIIIGSGSGGNILESALDRGLRTAMIDKGPTGGTCLNTGCVPSKLLIGAADRVMDIAESKRFSIEADIRHIDFRTIMNYMREYVHPKHLDIREAMVRDERFDFYETTAEFTGEYTLRAGTETLTAMMIFIAAGARAIVPRIVGLEHVNFLDNVTVLDLNRVPESLIIIGGGYIAAEYGHFFSAMGSHVTIMQMDDHLVPAEDEEVSELLEDEFRRRMDILLATEAVQVENIGEKCRVTGRNRETDQPITVEADRLMIAAGRRPNTDLLEVDRSGVTTDDNGYIITDEFLETTKKGIWAIGDVNGRGMFTHVANAEARLAWHNAIHDHRVPFDYTAVPHAVFTHPRIAAVGLTEREAAEEHDILVGKAPYTQVTKGNAIRDVKGFAKAIVDRGTGRILGFHIIGHGAPMIIQEVIGAMASGDDVDAVMSRMHIHPAGSELVLAALANLSKA